MWTMPTLYRVFTYDQSHHQHYSYASRGNYMTLKHVVSENCLGSGWVYITHPHLKWDCRWHFLQSWCFETSPRCVLCCLYRCVCACLKELERAPLDIQRIHIQKIDLFDWITTLKLVSGWSKTTLKAMYICGYKRR